MNIEQFVKSFYIFQDLTPKEFERVGAIFREQTYPRGAHLFHQESQPDHLFLVDKGKVQVFRHVNGARQNIVEIGAGETLGELSMFGLAVHSASAVASTEVVAFVTRGEDFAKLLADNAPGIGKIMGRLMEQTVRRFKLLEAKTLLEAVSREQEQDTTPEGRLMLAIARKEFVRVVFSTDIGKPMDALFHVIDVSGSLGAPLLRLSLDKDTSGREYIVPMSNVKYISFKDEKGKY